MSDEENPDEILISTEDLEFLQDQIKLLGSENKSLKDQLSEANDFDGKIEEIYKKCTKNWKHSGNIEKLTFIDSFIDSLQKEREQFGTKLEAILGQKENDASLKNKQIEENIKQLKAENQQIDDSKNTIQKQLDQFKKKLRDQMQTQINYLSSYDPKSMGSTGESIKLSNISVPEMESAPEEFVKSYDKLFEVAHSLDQSAKEENESQAKVSLEEMKNWEDKVGKLKGNSYQCITCN